MVDQTPSLMKTCSVCGQLKPLSAFLEISGPEGARYGNVCANCRKTQPEQEMDEGTRRQVGGSRIGSDERVVSETDKDEQRKKIRRDYDVDRKFSSDLFNQKSQTIQKNTDLDRRRREGTLGKSMFDEKKQPIQADENSFAAKEIREAEINLTVPIQDTQIPKEKRKTAQWGQFQAWLRGTPSNKQRGETKIAEHRQESKPEKPSERNIVDYVEKNLPEDPTPSSPSSGRRRT